MAEPTILEAGSDDDAVPPIAPVRAVEMPASESESDDEETAAARRQRNLQRAQQRRRDEEAQLQQLEQDDEVRWPCRCGTQC